MLSMQPAAVRQRRRREKQRLLPDGVTNVVTSPATSSHPPSVAPPSVTSAPSPATAAVTPERDLSRDVTRSSSLRETEVVTGPGADAFAAPTVLGGDSDGHGGTPLVEAAPPAPPRATSPEEAAMIAKAVGMYVGFGWGLLASRHADKLAPIAEMAMQAHPELKRLPTEQKLQFGLAAMVGMVEKSAMQVALDRNIRIPYQNEGIVGVAVATATLGIVDEFRTPKNDNVRDTWATEAPPAPPRDVSRPAPPPASSRAHEPIDAELDLDDPEFQSVRLQPEPEE